LAPRQAVIIPVNNEAHGKYSNDLLKTLKENNIRVELDDSNERISHKIRKYQTSKVKTQIVIGDEEVKNNSATIRFYGEEDSKTISVKELINIFND
jgi:threonyl-tRNA synthetase